jgi:hypothetical protein
MVDVHVVEDARPPCLLQPRDELCSEDVDLSVQQAPLIGDLVLLARQVGDEQLQVSIRQRCEIGQRFHGPPFLVEGSPAVKQSTGKGST